MHFHASKRMCRISGSVHFSVLSRASGQSYGPEMLFMCNDVPIVYPRAFTLRGLLYLCVEGSGAVCLLWQRPPPSFCLSCALVICAFCSLPFWPLHSSRRIRCRRSCKRHRNCSSWHPLRLQILPRWRHGQGGRDNHYLQLHLHRS